MYCSSDVCSSDLCPLDRVVDKALYDSGNEHRSDFECDHSIYRPPLSRTIAPLHVDDHLRGNAVPAPLSRPRQRPTTLSNPLSDQRACCRHLPLHRSRRHSPGTRRTKVRSEEHTSELQSLMRISYAVFCLKKKTITHIH